LGINTTGTTSKIAEVIQAETARYVAQCYELYDLPPLGALVRTGDIYGFVAGAGTAGLEPGRRPIARGRDETSEEAVYATSPQLSKLLRSEFTVIVAAHRRGETMVQYLPPRPARIHGFVYAGTPEEAREFARTFGFITNLLGAENGVAPEELTAAALRQLAAAQEDPHAFLVAAGKELAALLSGDFIRLKTILGRLR
jgi:hypothetical protein